MTAKEFKDKFWDGEKIKTKEVLIHVNTLETLVTELLNEPTIQKLKEINVITKSIKR